MCHANSVPKGKMASVSSPVIPEFICCRSAGDFTDIQTEMGLLQQRFERVRVQKLECSTTEREGVWRGGGD